VRAAWLRHMQMAAALGGGRRGRLVWSAPRCSLTLAPRSQTTLHTHSDQPRGPAVPSLIPRHRQRLKVMRPPRREVNVMIIISSRRQQLTSKRMSYLHRIRWAGVSGSSGEGLSL
jgi:hypothetical protein